MDLGRWTQGKPVTTWKWKTCHDLDKADLCGLGKDWSLRTWKRQTFEDLENKAL